MAAYSPVQQALLKSLIEDELVAEFGASDDASILAKYATAMSLAIAKHFYSFGGYPDEDDD